MAFLENEYLKFVCCSTAEMWYNNRNYPRILKHSSIKKKSYSWILFETLTELPGLTPSCLNERKENDEWEKNYPVCNILHRKLNLKTKYHSLYWLYTSCKLRVFQPLRDSKDKMKGGIGWNLRISGVERYIKDIYLMFLSREIDTKLCQSYTKTYIVKIYVHITWPELPPIAVQYTGHVIQTETRDNNTALPLVGVLVTWSGRINNIINYIY